MQLTMGPCVVQIWSRKPGNETRVDLDENAVALIVKVVEGPRERGHQRPTCFYAIDFGA